jgi:hypothetical protein
MKVRIAQSGGTGAASFAEVDGSPVGGTGGLFAVHPARSRGEATVLGGPWVLTHCQSGLALAGFATRAEAEDIGRWLHAAAPAAWELSDPEAVCRELPPEVRRWGARRERECDERRAGLAADRKAEGGQGGAGPAKEGG